MKSRLPIIKQVYVEPDAAAIYERLRQEHYSFLLESSMVLEEIGRYSFLGCDPFLIICSKDGKGEIIKQGNTEYFTGSPLAKLKELLLEYKYVPAFKYFPFSGGAVGFFSYDLGRQIEVLPSLAADDLKVPDFCLGFYDVIVVIEHFSNKVYISSTGFPMRGKEGYDRAVYRVKELEERIRKKCSGGLPEKCTSLKCNTGLDQLTSNFTPENYCRIVQKAKNYIKAGDIFEVNLSQRFELPLVEDPWQVYKQLRGTNKAPFAGFLNFGKVKVLSSSPERFLKLNGSRVETRPIKGTRPRGRDPESDRLLRQELLDSEKDKAELMMIVDLERNDLGRVCRVGSVRVPDLVRLEEYLTVFHLVSTVEGTLLPGKTVCDLLEAAFPGGSITGAPKIRSMEIIEELETVRRGIYTGSIGYIDFNGDADLNIVIRTIICRDGRAYFQVGGAVTLDSDPKLEYYETLDKGRGLMKALGFGKGELYGWKI